MNNVYEAIMFGEGDDSVFRQTCNRYLDQAKEQEVRLQVEIRSSARGTSTSMQESKFSVDPQDTTADAIQSEVIQRLSESPGEGFQGQIRILFRESGSSDNKFGSFQRTISRAYLARVQQSEDDDEGYDDDDESYDDDEARGGGRREIDNSATELAELRMLHHQRQQMDMGGQGQPLNRTPALVDAATLKEYMDVAFGFTFRAQAQNAVMFQRTTEMMEAMGLRFGVMPPDQIAAGRAQPQIAQGGGDGGAGVGMLMGLFKAAMSMAAAESPAEVAETVGSLAVGQKPDDSGVRKVAAKAGARALQALDRSSRGHAIQRRHQEHIEPQDPQGPPSGYDDLGDYDDLDEVDDVDQGPGPASAPPDMTDLSPEEMKAAVIKWIQANPENKSAIMGMVPDLMEAIE